MQNLFRILFWLALAFAFVMAVLPHPPQLTGASDKTEHMLAFATLAVLGVLGWPQLGRLRLGMALVLVGAGIEVVQMIPMLHRDADWRDLAADTIAIVAILAVAGVLMGIARKVR